MTWRVGDLKNLFVFCQIRNEINVAILHKSECIFAEFRGKSKDKDEKRFEDNNE